VEGWDRECERLFNPQSEGISRSLQHRSCIYTPGHFLGLWARGHQSPLVVVV
jgi:hypothetical protein